MALSVVGEWIWKKKTLEDVFSKPMQLASPWGRWKPFQVKPGDICRCHRPSEHAGIRHHRVGRRWGEVFLTE